ncbi:HET-domain-containing protein [Xylariaceae sp. FL1272]|nr:HET-domain-containing protein [Xylariaceae sp. FL1272]
MLTTGMQPTLATIENADSQIPCTLCLKLVPDREQVQDSEITILKTSYKRDDLYPAFPALSASAEAGCGLCSLIQRRITSIPATALRAVQRSEGGVIWSSNSQKDERLIERWDCRVVIEAYFDYIPYLAPAFDQYPTESQGHVDQQHGGAVTSLHITYKPLVKSPLDTLSGWPWSGEDSEFTVFDSQDHQSRIPRHRRCLPSSTTLSQENVILMLEWIDNCVKNHSLCSNVNSTAEFWIPDRLLEVQDEACRLRVRLIDKAQARQLESIRYAALSHVWGEWESSPSLRLLQENHEIFQGEIHESTLPKSFLDACKVCSRLGIQYLWIDSLCIIQDSPEDWNEQAVLMHLIYRHALVTIVATSATSCHDGFLDRDTDHISAMKVSYAASSMAKNGTDENETYMIICDYPKSSESYRTYAINGSRWNTRAWTMQERSLSTRMIHFCRNKLFFECRECLGSEENEPVQEFEKMNSVLWPRDSNSFAELRQHWQLLLGEYTGRALTVQSDKLIAIQSVAEDMAATTGREYIRYAGMWRDNLRNELLWYAPSGDTQRPAEWRAPSWSWASVEGQVLFWHRDFRASGRSSARTLLHSLAQHPLEVLSVDRKYPDPASALPGWIEVEGLFIQINLIEKTNTGGRVFFPYDLTTSNNQTATMTAATLQVFAHGRLDFEEFSSDAQHAKLIYLHVNDDARVTGLILSATGNADSQVVPAWKRVGIATLFFDRSDKPILDSCIYSSVADQRIMVI